MPDILSFENDFLKKAAETVENNLADERFGVSELAAEMSMSRSNLLRKIRKLTNLSASQFIRQVRLENGMELLKQTSLNVSEVAFQSGFSSTSYFIKCFREYYGYPPGEAGKRGAGEPKTDNMENTAANHQLAAIMFTDIQGYTALMQHDEARAVEYRNHHREIFNAATAKYNGRILQYYGDGTLSTFSSAIDAVKCGVEMQLAFGEEPRIPVRIGIHTGDIIFTEDDIIGDGVNVASRIESLATVGSVFISEKVYDEIKNQPDIYTTSMGIFELKNIDKPVEVFAITNKGLVVPDKTHEDGKLKPDLAKGLKPGNKKKMPAGWIWGVLAGFGIMGIYLIYLSGFFDKTNMFRPHDDRMTAQPSIAVLPFINDSYDSSNVYIINGLMESVLNNLQKIKNLRVVSRTSVEKFRNSGKTAPEIADELNVNYLIEGSGQKIGDRILLHVQLIEGPVDRHLWSEQYNRKVGDIFDLQIDLAKNIARQIQVIVTPEEEKRIDKIPTDNLVAYDHFLKGLDLFHLGTREGLEKSITWFKKAISEDEHFARAYADLAIAWYYLDIYKAEKQFSDSIKIYADKAMLNDPRLSQSLIAKALFYMENKENDRAVPYLEKALEYHPNSAFVINLLSDFYTNFIPDTKKYLEYALKGVQLDIGAHDSTTAGYIYLHLSNALIQTGFIDEALKYIDKSLTYDPSNLYSAYVKAYILYAKTRDLKKTRDELITVLKRDTNRMDVLQEVGKICYYQRDYKTSYRYYKRFIDLRESLNLDIFQAENAKIGVVLNHAGETEKASQYFEDYKNYAQNDPSIYRNLSLAMYYSYNNDTHKALEQLQLFSQQNNFQYWVLLFLDIDPLVDNIKNLPGFKRTYQTLDKKFREEHKRIKASLEEKGLI